MRSITYSRKLMFLLVLLSILLIAGCAGQVLEKNAEHIDETKEFEIGVHAFAERMQENPNAVLLDVREPEEYEEEHIEGAVLLPLDKISQSSLDELGIKKDDEMLLHCRSGRRSAKAYKILTALGYTNVKSLGGGLIHWKEDGFSLVSGTYKSVIMGNSDEPIIEEISGPAAVQGSTTYDFGKIPQLGGVVSTTFQLSNAGTEVLEVDQISTSCGCTSAEIDKTSIQPGETGTITVYFNPNLHEEPIERFSRTVFVPTNDPNNPELEYRVWVDILEGE